MASKRVIVNTKAKRGQYFKVSTSGSKYFVYNSRGQKIGEVRSMEDAVMLARTDAVGEVLNVEIRDL